MRKSKYNVIWDSMEIGGREFIKKGDGVLLDRLRKAIYGSLKFYKRGTEKDFSVVTEDYPRGVSIYRVK